ncbi:MAG: hypothetical protein H7039_03360 [Bryobacteraceae bacterium]|nr:hypothetical protein [Bryobacteraceae bacterium]
MSSRLPAPLVSGLLAIAGGAILVGTIMIGTIVVGAASGGDVKVLPPVKREFLSPSGSHVFEVSGTAGWKSPYAHAELFSTSRGSRRSLWSKDLPHRFGPGSAIVSDTGRVLLIDEWLKTPSPYAVVLFAETGTEVARYSMQDIAQVSGVPSSKLVTTARFGPWMSALPRAEVSRNTVILEAGNVRLELNLDSGRIVRKGT